MLWPPWLLANPWLNSPWACSLQAIVLDVPSVIDRQLHRRDAAAVGHRRPVDGDRVDPGRHADVLEDAVHGVQERQVVPGADREIGPGAQRAAVAAVGHRQRAAIECVGGRVGIAAGRRCAVARAPEQAQAGSADRRIGGVVHRDREIHRVVERALLEVLREPDQLAAGVGVAEAGVVLPAEALGERAIGALVVVHRQHDLLEVVGALRAPRRLARACTAGSKSAINTAMMAITTRSSISVKPCREDGRDRRREMGFMEISLG